MRIPSRFRRLAFRVFPALVVVALQVASSGCATKAVARLPTPVPGEQDGGLLDAHANLERAYAHCTDEYEAESLPIGVLLAGASATSTVAMLAASGALAFALPEPYDVVAAVAGGGAAVVFSGLTVFFASDAFPFYERADVREAALQKARYDAKLALRTRKPAEVEIVTRSLYENCRVAAITPNGDAASSVFRDLQRYRREAQGQRRWVKALEEQRESEKKELETLRAEQVARNERLRTLEKTVEDLTKVLEPSGEASGESSSKLETKEGANVVTPVPKSK